MLFVELRNARSALSPTKHEVYVGALVLGGIDVCRRLPSGPDTHPFRRLALEQLVGLCLPMKSKGMKMYMMAFEWRK